MTQRELWPDSLPATPEKTEAQPAPKPPQPVPVAAVSSKDDIHDPFSGISIDITPLARVVANRDPFAQALRDDDPVDEAMVTDDVYSRERGEDIE